MYTGLGHINESQTELIAQYKSATKRQQVHEAFCAVAKLITTVKTKEDVLKSFDVLQGASPISNLKHLKLSISDEHITVVEAECNWAGAKTWVQWWMRKKHLQMLTKPFIV